ncbi:MAG: hypothetical protein OXB97_13985, partial [Rhodospirillales bacterium]|nr:hypothetical protein [Rhodospirillales bacterium]
SALKSSSRIAMRSTISHRKNRYQPSARGHSARRRPQRNPPRHYRTITPIRRNHTPQRRQSTALPESNRPAGRRFSTQPPGGNGLVTVFAGRDRGRSRRSRADPVNGHLPYEIDPIL